MLLSVIKLKKNTLAIEIICTNTRKKMNGVLPIVRMHGSEGLRKQGIFLFTKTGAIYVLATLHLNKN